MSCGSSSLWNRIRGRRARSGSTSMRATTRCTVTRKGDSFTATTVATVICRCTSSAASICCVRGCANRIRMPRPQRSSSHRQAGPAIARLHLPHSPIVQPQPPGGGQGGVSVEGGDPRFVVTHLSPRQASAKRLYEKLYCARGERDNRIKEQPLDLFADRTSAHTMRANPLRLYFSSFAYVLMQV